MKYFIRGGGSVSLSQKDFIAGGGEGKVYGRNNTIYKIYNDPAKMIPDAKIRELQSLDRPSILRPLDVVLDTGNRPVGFTMQWIRDTVPLCRLFTSDFRSRSGFTDAAALELVENMKEVIRFVHLARCLIVDGNEFNYLVDQTTLVRPYFIDVDSWQTPTFPATVIMPSIRDWHTKIFSELSDWFSFAIVACQLFVGVHPFKGRHPDFKKNDIESRMKASISIFNPKVTLPPAARDFGAIPSAYLSWFMEMFENGKRIPPPDLPGHMTSLPGAPTPLIESENRFEITEIRKFDSTVLWHRTHAGISLTGTRKQIYIGDKSHDVRFEPELVFTPRKLKPVLAWIYNGKLKLEAPDKTAVIFPEINADSLLRVENALYIRHDGNLTQIDMEDAGERIVAAVRNVWEIMPHASEIFDGLVFQNVLGRACLMIPLSEPGKDGSCIIRFVPELDGYRIVDAKHDGGVCMFIAYRNRRYDRIVIRFDRDYASYHCRMSEDTGPGSANFVTLENGIVVSLNDDGTLEIFPKSPDKTDVRQVKGPDFGGAVRLCREGNTVMFFRGKRLFRLRMLPG